MRKKITKQSLNHPFTAGISDPNITMTYWTHNAEFSQKFRESTVWIP